MRRVVREKNVAIIRWNETKNERGSKRVSAITIYKCDLKASGGNYEEDLFLEDIERADNITMQLPSGILPRTFNSAFTFFKHNEALVELHFESSSGPTVPSSCLKLRSSLGEEGNSFWEHRSRNRPERHSTIRLIRSIAEAIIFTGVNSVRTRGYMRS